MPSRGRASAPDPSSISVCFPATCHRSPSSPVARDPCSAAIRAEEGIVSGSTVDVLSSAGEYLARAAYSPRSQICARVWTFVDEPVNADFFRRRIRSAVGERGLLRLETWTDAFRLVFAESDHIPGLVVDRYRETLVVQFLTAGAAYWSQILIDLLSEETGLNRIYERSDADVRELEGLAAQTGWLRGGGANEAPASLRVEIAENGLKFSVDIARGHKTGFYLDQRDNRKRVRDLAQGTEVLDCFCYTGGFMVSALAGGARSVLAVDSSADALRLGAENLSLNGIGGAAADLMEGDVFQVLRRLRDQGRSFDMVILDPPKFAPTAAYADKAARGYKDINLLALKLLRPYGILVTFSCSGGIDAALFQKIVASAALDAGAEAQILEHLGQAPDHPVAMEFPEGTYLKGLVILKLS
jgi:23S rRNA (cytosine1962-C5)-methyltransferase